MTIELTVYFLGEDVQLNTTVVVEEVSIVVYDGYFSSGGGGGAVDSVNGKTGVVVLNASDIAETSTLKWLTSTLKDAYDGAVTNATNAVNWISSNGTNLLNHLVNTSNPHNTTASQVGAYTTSQVDTALDLKANKSEVATILFKSITQTIVTNKTDETSIYSIPLPIDGGNYIIELFSNSHIDTYPGFTQNHRIRCGTYLAPIDGITGANAIGNQTQIFNNQGAGNGIPIYINRTFIFKGGASGSIYSVQSGIAEIYNSATPTTLMSANFTTQHYLYVCLAPVNSGIIQHNFIVIKTIKI